MGAPLLDVATPLSPLHTASRRRRSMTRAPSTNSVHAARCTPPAVRIGPWSPAWRCDGLLASEPFAGRSYCKLPFGIEPSSKYAARYCPIGDPTRSAGSSSKVASKRTCQRSFRRPNPVGRSGIVRDCCLSQPNRRFRSTFGVLLRRNSLANGQPICRRPILLGAAVRDRDDSRLVSVGASARRPACK